MDITLTANDVELIVKSAVKTGYDPAKDDDYSSQNWHAHDDAARSVVPFSSLSEETRHALLAYGKDIPDNATVEFRWNEEWGNWSDVLSDNKSVLNFYAVGLPWAWIGDGFRDFSDAQ